MSHYDQIIFFSQSPRLQATSLLSSIVTVFHLPAPSKHRGWLIFSWRGAGSFVSRLKKMVAYISKVPKLLCVISYVPFRLALISWYSIPFKSLLSPNLTFSMTTFGLILVPCNFTNIVHSWLLTLPVFVAVLLLEIGLCLLPTTMFKSGASNWIRFCEISDSSSDASVCSDSKRLMFISSLACLYFGSLISSN